MMPRHRVQTLFIWLTVALCVLLGWTIQRQITTLPVTRAAAPPADPVAPAALASFAVPDRGSLAVIVERPVFSESRRPSASEEGPAPALDFTLVGVMISDRERSALVQSPHGGAVQRLAEGEEVDGWIVVDIEPDHIVVRHDTSEAEMPLDYSAPAPPVPVAKTPAPNGVQPNATKPIGAEPNGTEAQGIIEGQPPEVLPPTDDDDGDDEQQSTN
jgi:type II secretory pathway component PulC